MNSYEARKMHKYDVCRPLSRATGEIFFVALLEANLGEINWELLSLKEAPLSASIISSCHPVRYVESNGLYRLLKVLPPQRAVKIFVCVFCATSATFIPVINAFTFC